MKAILAAAAAFSAFAADAKVATATPFADNMVLQRGRAVPVWGTADAGEAVTVLFAGHIPTGAPARVKKYSTPGTVCSKAPAPDGHLLRN